MRLWPLRRKPAARPARSYARGGLLPGVVRSFGEDSACDGGIPVRPDRARIAVLEFTELGVMPTPGTTAAAVVNAHLGAQQLREAMARPVDRTVCPHEDVVDTSTIGEQRRRGMCVRCGTPAVEDDHGRWEFLPAEPA